MSAIPNELPLDGPEAAPVSNDAWYLHSEGRRFGPLTEDEMRGYFRAGMVKQHDQIAVPGQFGTVTPVAAAALLDMPQTRPFPVDAAPLAATTIIVTPDGPLRLSPILLLGAMVALIGAGYFALHEHPNFAPTRHADAQVAAVEAAAAPVASPAPRSPFDDLRPGSDASLAPPPIVDSPPSASQEQKTPVLDASTPGASPAPLVDSDPWYTQAVLLANSEDWAALAAHGAKWTVAQPNRDVAWWCLGLAHSALGHDADAILALNRALSISPAHRGVRKALEDVYLRGGRYREAADILVQLVDELPADAGLWNDLGIAWANLGEYDDSVRALEKAVQIKPDYRKAWVNLAQSYAHFGYMDKARDAMAKANAL